MTRPAGKPASMKVKIKGIHSKMIFDWMPLIFTFMLAGFPAGLVIYWAWNNLLSVIQQSFIMRRNGVKVELFDNLKSTFVWKKAESKT